MDKAVRELGDDHYPLRHAAFERLLAWAVADPELLKKLPTSDKDPEINESLGKLPQEARERFLKARKAFYQGELVRLAGKDAPLLKVLQALLDGATQGTVSDAQGAVARQKDKSLASALAGYLAECVLENPDPGVRWEAVNTLGQLGEKSVVPQIAKLLEDADPGVRGRAAQTLGYLDEKSVAPRVIPLLDDADPGVRWAAAEALGALGDKSAVPMIVKLLDDADPDMRQGAACALGRLGEKSVVPRIIPLLQDTRPSVRWVSAEALGTLGEKSAAPRLATLLGDANPGVCKAAASALRTLSGETWPDDTVEESAKAWWIKHRDDAAWEGNP